MGIGSMFGFKRLHEIVIQNEKYLLTQYFEAGFHYVYITDKTTVKFVQKKLKTSWRHKKDRKTFNKKILSYFKDCKKNVDFVLRNAEYPYTGNNYYNEMFQDISNMNCN